MNDMHCDSGQLPPAPSVSMAAALQTLLGLSRAGIQLLTAECPPSYHSLATILSTALQIVEQELHRTEEPACDRLVHSTTERLRSLLTQMPEVRDLRSPAAALAAAGSSRFLPSPGVSEPLNAPPLLRFPTDLDPELADDFIAEAQEHIASAEEALLALETDPEDQEAIDAVFRAFHTAKGTATFLGLTPIAELAHYTESLLSRMREGSIRCIGGYADLALRATDTLKELVYILQETLGGVPSRCPQTFMSFLQTLARPEAVGISEDTVPVPPPRLGDLLVAEGLVERQALEDVAATSQGQPLGLALLRSGIVSLPEVAHALRTQQRLSGMERAMRSSVQVRTTHLEHLGDTVGELVKAHAITLQDEVLHSSEAQNLHKKLLYASKIIQNLCGITHAMRLLPCATVFHKMTRVVRDVARKSQKLVTLVTQGEDTDIDRHVAEMLTAPLMHLVCNAVSHGIELPERREQSGKPRIGMVCLKAYHANRHVVIELQDDGQGLDLAAIRARALEKGFMDATAELDDWEIEKLIFQPGFSTVSEVSEIAGRGVGLDVVRRNIETLKGRIEVTSIMGKGTTFTLHLPLVQSRGERGGV